MFSQSACVLLLGERVEQAGVEQQAQRRRADTRRHATEWRRVNKEPYSRIGSII